MNPNVWVVLSWLVAASSVDCHRTLRFSILEEQPKNTLVGNIAFEAGLATKYNRNNDILRQLLYSLRQQTCCFQVDEETGDIRSKEIIDREKLCPYAESCQISFEVSVKPLMYFQILKVVVQIEDINDHVPAFHQDRFSLEIIETTNPGSQFSIPGAEDADSEPLSIYSYQLISDSGIFELNATKQVDGSHDVRLKLCRYLDRELQDYFSLIVIARDGGIPAKTASMILDVFIRDANDNNPQFDLAIYEKRISENLAVGTSILRVHAYDPDAGLNGIVRYSFAEEVAQSSLFLFEINSTTGVICINGSIDFERESLYSLTVVAIDLGPNSLPTFSKVTIEVLDVNDNAPKISINLLIQSRHAQVVENAPVGTFVCHVAVSDADSPETGNGKVDCSIDSVDFRLEAIYSEYKLVTNRVFDREKETQATLVIRCHDHGVPRLTSARTLVIQISDENDNSPQMTSDVFFVPVVENNILGAAVTRINATDRDIGRNALLRYRLEPLNGTPRDSVTLDGVTGIVTANVAFDYEKRQSFSYLVTVRDSGDKPRSTVATLSLNILDLNDELPVFEADSYHFTTVENQPIGVLVGRVKAFDADTSYDYHKVSYYLEGLWSRYFTIDNYTGEIYTAVVLDHEVLNTARFSVRASNDPPSSPSFLSVSCIANVTVRVDDINDNTPVILRPNETFHIWTRIPPGYVIAKVEAIDPDEGINGLLSYRIVSGNEEQLFRLDEFSGEITSAREMGADEAGGYSLVVVVQDNVEPRRSASTLIQVLVNSSVQLQMGELANAPAKSDGVLTMIVVASGAVVIIKVVVITLVCVKVHAGKVKDAVEKVNMSLSDNSIYRSESNFPAGSSADRLSDCGLDMEKGRDRVKKEVTFCLDLQRATVERTSPLSKDSLLMAVDGRFTLGCGGGGGARSDVNVKKIYPESNPQPDPQPMFAVLRNSQMVGANANALDNPKPWITTLNPSPKIWSSPRPFVHHLDLENSHRSSTTTTAHRLKAEQSRRSMVPAAGQSNQFVEQHHCTGFHINT